MLLKMHTFCARSSRCFLFQTQNHRSVRVTTSRKQEGTKAERSVLLYNNRCCCTTTDPRRVSKQVSREPPQAWLFGLVRLAPQAERTKSAAGRRKAPQASQFSAPQAEKIRGVLRSPCSSRSGFACAALAEQHVPPLVVHKGPREGEGKSLLQKRLLCCFSFFTRATRKGGGAKPLPGP